MTQVMGHPATEASPTSESTEWDSTVLAAQGVALDVDAQIVFRDGEALPRLAHKEFELLKFLLEHAGRVVATEEILERVWGYEPSTAGAATLVTHIRRLRSHVERDSHHPVLIRNLRGLGYIIDVVPVPEGGSSSQ